jgi:hypothetical protein
MACSTALMVKSPTTVYLPFLNSSKAAALFSLANREWCASLPIVSLSYNKKKPYYKTIVGLNVRTYIFGWLGVGLR